MKSVVILVFDGVHLLDVAGPAAVFADTEAVLGRAAYELFLGSTAGGPVVTVGGIPLVAKPLNALPARPDIVLVPGGVSAEALSPVIRDAVLRKWLASHRPARLASVCSGAFVLGVWGYLEGRKATTHWMAADRLADLLPQSDIRKEALFVRDDDVWTSAGVSTGIDMALAMVEQDFGREVSIGVARRLVLQARRPGHQAQFSDTLTAQAGPYADLFEWVRQNLQAPLDVEALAERVGQSPRTFHRKFTAAVGHTPAAYVERMRVEAARLLLTTDVPLQTVALRTGFATTSRLRRAFLSILGVAPADYRLMHGTQPATDSTG